MAEKKKPKNLENVLDQIQKDHAKTLEDAFKFYDAHHKDEHQNEIYNTIFAPAMDEFYNKFTSHLDKNFKDDKASTFQKETELKKAAVEGLKAYFEKVHPGMLKKALDGVEDVEDQFHLLSSLYDQHHGVTDRQSAHDAQRRGYISIAQIVDSASKNKKSTAGHVKRSLYETKGAHATQGMIGLNQQATSKYFAGFHQIDIGHHLKDKWGLNLGDVVEYKTKTTGELLGLHTSLREGGQVNYQEYGLKYKKPEKKTK